jgi:hypothetical protein
VTSVLDGVLKLLGFHPDNLHKRVLDQDANPPNIMVYHSNPNVVLNPAAIVGTTNLTARTSFGEGSLAWKRHTLTLRDRKTIE